MVGLDFNPANVRFEWSPDIDGCVGYFANTVPRLRRAVADVDFTVFGTLTGPVDSSDMMLGCRELGRRFMFFYHDWLHEVYHRYKAGQSYVFRRSPKDDWEPLPQGLPPDSGLWSRDYQYLQDTNCPWERLLEWLAGGYGLVRGVSGGQRVVSFTASVRDSDLDKPVPVSVQVRPFGGDVWVSPTLTFMDSFLGQ